ncbi:MAG: Re/Si-specific NAD(P)(+) transhydrogenase subunit alpha [Candidatus Zixiibacteriota bacterium]
MTDNAFTSKTTVAVPKENFPGERRVALTPDTLPTLIKAGINILVQSGAGSEAGFADAQYREKGAEIVDNRRSLFEVADVVVQVRGLGANPVAGKDDLSLYRAGQTIIAQFEPLAEPEAVKELAARKVTALSLELMPRITRAQSMDVLSSMATIAGYKAVILAAEALPKIFPMLMTAAGTISPAHVFVIGAGVAGLQAIATSRRLGAIVKGYDIRPAVKEQVESLGAKFVELPLEAAGAEDKGGYAKAMGEEFYRKQRELMAKVIAESNVVITTALVPGKKSPILITAEMAKGMAPGSVIVDLAAEKGGNCELTRPGETVSVNGITIIGPVNITSTVPFHASQMYGKNVSTFLTHLVKKGKMALDMTDEITRETMLTRDGEITHPQIRQLLNMTPLASANKEA